MSQKPKMGAPSKTGSALKATGAPRVVAKEPAAKAVPVPAAKAAPVPAAKAAPVPAAKADPVKVMTPVVPVIKPEPMAKPTPFVQAESVAKPLVAAAMSAQVPVGEPITEPAPKPAVVLPKPITAAVATIAAVTAEAVKPSSATKPTKPTITQGIKTMMKSTEDFVAFGQANLEAFVKSGQIWSAGVQELTKQFATSAKASFDESVSTFKAISTAKSVKEAMDLQSTFAKAALEKAMAESNKLTDASIKLTEQTLAPITARVTVAVENFGKAA